MKVEKWQALGNDYLIIERSEIPWDLSAPRIRRLCNPHFGLGSDGVCLVSEPESGGSAARVAIFNPDGSRAELSGNGVRQVALYLHSHGRVEAAEFAIETDAGLVRPRIISESEARVGMGKATTVSQDYPDGDADGKGVIEAGGREWDFQHVSIGNPQCAVEVDQGLEELDLAQIGAEIEQAQLFPNRTNVSFWSRQSDSANAVIRARIFERGVGETLSSGTGASGAATAAHLSGLNSPIEVELDGGSLMVEIDPDLNVHLTGWAVPVYQAELSARLISEIEAEIEFPSLGTTA